MKSFWEKEYGAERIKLVVTTNDPVSIKLKITEVFSQVPSRGLPPPEYKMAPPHKQTVNELIYVKAEKNHNIILILFDFDYQENFD